MKKIIPPLSQIDMAARVLLAFGIVFAVSLQRGEAQTSASKRFYRVAKPQGSLVIVGGGSTPPAAIKELIARAGGPDAPLVVLAQTQEDAVHGAPDSAAFLRENGARNVEAPVGVPSEQIKALLAKACGVWIPGGDQSRFTRTFPESTGIPEAIRDVYRRGGTVGGTSAGASLMGDLMPTGEETKVEGVKEGACPVAPGLGLLSGVIVDQHFFVRNRLMRLLTATLEHPDHLGMGIEQGGWITVQHGQLRVGAEQVTLLCVKGQVGRKELRLGAENVALRVLLTGETASLP